MVARKIMKITSNYERIYERIYERRPEKIYVSNC